MNPDLGRLGDDDACRRWRARMCSHRRGAKPSRSNSYKHYRRHRSVPLRGHHQGRGQAKSQSTTVDNAHTPGFHGGVSPSPASSTLAPAAGARYGAAHNPSGNPNARQSGHFRTDKWLVDDGTPQSARPPPARQAEPLFCEMLVYLVPVQPARQRDFCL